MCYNSSQTKTVKEIEHRFDVSRTKATEIYEHNFKSFRFNGFDHPPLLIIEQESKELYPANWGILPKGLRLDQENEYYKQYAGGTLNTKSERVFDLKVASENIMERRCILPLTGFFENHKFGESYHFYFERKDKDFLSVACLYCETIDGTKGFTMLTKNASPLFQKVHNEKNKDGNYRQIVLLSPEMEKEWLRDDLTENGIKELIEYPFDNSELTTHPVNKIAYNNYRKVNDESIIAKWEYPELVFDEDLHGII